MKEDEMDILLHKTVRYASPTSKMTKTWVAVVMPISSTR